MTAVSLQRECRHIAGIIGPVAEMMILIGSGWSAVANCQVYPKGSSKPCEHFNGASWEDVLSQAEQYALSYLDGCRVMTGADLGIGETA